MVKMSMMSDEKQPYKGYDNYAKAFEHHQITDLDAQMALFEWSNPKTAVMKVKLLFQPNFIIIYGDMDPVVYRHSDKDSLRWALTSPNFDYVSGKLQTHFKAYNPEGTMQMIQEMVEETFHDKFDGTDTDPEQEYRKWIEVVFEPNKGLLEDYETILTFFDAIEMEFDAELVSYSWETNEAAKWGFAALRTFLDAYERRKQEQSDEQAQSHPGWYIVRLWDGMDGEWMDITGPVPYAEAMKVWLEKTEGGKKSVTFDDIDRYAIFPADTKMVFTDKFPMYPRG